MTGTETPALLEIVWLASPPSVTRVESLLIAMIGCPSRVDPTLKLAAVAATTVTWLAFAPLLLLSLTLTV